MNTPTFPPLLGDPVVAHALGAALAVILLLGAAAKLRDLSSFRASVAAYQLLPELLVPAVTLLLPLWELACGVAVLLAPADPLTGTATAALLGLVTGAIALNLLRGHREIGCGCSGLFGHGDEPGLSWSLVARNAGLLATLALATAPATGRALVGVDYLSVAGATLALLGLYVAAHQLLTHHPRLMAIKRS